MTSHLRLLNAADLFMTSGRGTGCAWAAISVVFKLPSARNSTKAEIAASPGVTEKALNRTTAQLEVELADADVDGLRMRLLQQARTRARRLVLVCWLFSWCVMVGGYRDREAVWHRGQCGQQGGSGV
jgi:hypothetical protein